MSDRKENRYPLLPQQCELLLTFLVFPLRGLAGPSFSLCCRWAYRPSGVCSTIVLTDRIQRRRYVPRYVTRSNPADGCGIAAGVWLQPRGCDPLNPPPLQRIFSRFEATELSSAPFSIFLSSFISVERMMSPRHGKLSYFRPREKSKPDSHKPQHFCFILVRVEA